MYGASEMNNFANKMDWTAHILYETPAKRGILKLDPDHWGMIHKSQI